MDQSLRPANWHEYIGQDKVKTNLKILIEAAKKRSEPVDHLLLYGPAGLGKTTLAYIIAREMNTNIRITSGPAIEKVGDLASILTNLSAGDILFIDEAHRLNKAVEEILYPAMENRMLHIIIGKGPSARTLQLDLPPFSLIAATTRAALLSNPLRSRFGATFRLDFYGLNDIENILRRSASLMNLSVDLESLGLIAASSRCTPRVANRLLKRVRDYAEVEGEGVVTKEIATKALNLLEVDHLGLESADRRLMEAIIKKFNGGPVGLQALAAATSEELDTIEDMYEPYLLQLGFIQRTARGRIATKLAYEHLGLQSPPENQNLL
ncbi:MAG: Holliday junction ATP-dependent DNA helicase RuvB [Candidatus Azambacteria bacterium GW2011_GWA2_42_9]|uniref:Holliday junction branch migration complex subunit RuvB n=4 Tax=Candidatus Azamiibacteriota TaxID=1752741 RepID=A0A0G0ZC49_9BACT|nr:MAG: Holliday junction ATP-dependent DNA helicase RuvB [Candidatus Azambacteria bacterium GW2011_GWB1_42_17]KKS46287.1 MAG: Holliday junction ATP-dependent DNA helicase RuvB [Candidatus Azambacteria bacterium GW2011_GWA1_42_19]KKS75686.1 MAG: Holliday junction ATP-dependent DNA helicase RuvB [Candidatus Azambacteria bacterium GW2011_GWA2_42_9]KKS88551.1 MAG: Holliday junction DNA helicase RuvB, holliday junction DNA helicase RuvB [Parcubacteria group bacterium GW2011_GWC1_43_11]